MKPSQVDALKKQNKTNETQLFNKKMTLLIVVESQMHTSHPEAVPAQVALAQSETIRSEDLDTTAASHGKLTMFF